MDRKEMKLRKEFALLKRASKHTLINQIKYAKKDDNYEIEYTTYGCRLKEKVNKKGEIYLSAFTKKGVRSFKQYSIKPIFNFKSFKKSKGISC